MAEAFNPYTEWLELPSNLAEPNHYQLLGLRQFESDQAKIAKAAETAMNKVRSFRPGANARAWSKLLDELLLAKSKLLDADRKAEYDVELRDWGSGSGANGSSTSASPTPVPAAANSSADRGRMNAMFPPGMGPNSGKSAPEPPSLAPSKRNDAFPPRSTATGFPAASPQVSSSAPTGASHQLPAPHHPPAQPATPQRPDYQAPPTNPAAWPDSMLHPPGQGAPVGYHAPSYQASVYPPNDQQLNNHGARQQPPYAAIPTAMPAHGSSSQPGGQGQPGYQPMTAQPAYGQPQYGQPQYGQPQYAQANPYGAPPYDPNPPAYAQPANPYAQPAYSQPQYGATPYGNASYGNAPFGQTAIPMATPVTGVPLGGPPMNAEIPGQGMGGYGAYAPQIAPLAPSMHTAMPATFDPSVYNPMAPVAVPMTLPEAQHAGQAAIPTGAIPTGKAKPRPTPADADKSPATSGPAPRPTSAIKTNSFDSNQPSNADKILFWGTGAAIVLLIAAIGFAIIQANRSKSTTQEASNPPQNVKPPVASPNNTPLASPNKTNPISTPPGPTNPNNAIPGNVAPGSATKPTEPAPALPTVSTKPAETTIKPNEPEVVGTNKPAIVEMTPQPPVNVPPANTVPTPPAPMPMPPAPPEMPAETKQTPVELASLSKAMTTAREALGERNFEEVDKQLGIAEKLAKTDDQNAKVNRLKLLTSYVKQAQRSIKTLMADPDFDAGSELMIGTSTVVIVVERTPETLVIRINGMNRSYSLKQLPEGLSMALLDKRLDDNDPVTKLIKGAFYAASKSRTDEISAKAKAMWEQATRAGADAGDLPLVLTDTYEFQ